MWDERYREEEFAYGKAPNDFIRDHAGPLHPSGTVVE